MFPITVTITANNPADLAAVNAFIASRYPAPGAQSPDHPNGQVASIKEIHQAKVAEVAAAQVEKPRRTPKADAPTPAEPTNPPAPTSRTAEAVAADAPAPTASEPTPSAASAEVKSQASTAAEPFPYAKLQALVFKLLPDHGAALLDISKKHGAAKFKELPADRWEAAYNDLVSTYGG